MSTNWTNVRDGAIDAAKDVLKGAWDAAGNGATAQIAALVSVAKYIEDNKKKMEEAEIKSLMEQQKIALQNVLTGYEAIGIATAQNATAAVIKIIAQAVPALVGLA